MELNSEFLIFYISCLQVTIANSTFHLIGWTVFNRYVAKRKQSRLKDVYKLRKLGATENSILQGVARLRVVKKRTRAGISIIAISSSFLLVHVALSLLFSRLVAQSTWSNAFVISFNLDSVLTDLGMRLVCGTQKPQGQFQSRKSSQYTRRMTRGRNSLAGGLGLGIPARLKRRAGGRRTPISPITRLPNCRRASRPLAIVVEISKPKGDDDDHLEVNLDSPQLEPTQ
jgi:hypothetical protein